MQDLYNNIALGLIITAFVLFITRVILCFKRDGLKGGFIAKGYWGLWVIGIVFLILGFGAHNLANQYKLTDPKEIASTKEFAKMMMEGAANTPNAPSVSTAPSATTATPPTASVTPVAANAAPLPADTLAGPSPTFVSEPNGGEWTTSYTQGVQEFIYRQKDKFELVIDCGSDNPSISTFLTINGQQISQQDVSGSNAAFDMLVGDHTYTHPFDTTSEVNGGANFAYFWDHLRIAKSVVLIVNSVQYNIPTVGLHTLMPGSSSPLLQCKADI